MYSTKAYPKEQYKKEERNDYFVSFSASSFYQGNR